MSRKLNIARDLRLEPDYVGGRTFADDELIWAAGLFEGEGTVTIGRRGSDETYRLVVVISNTDEEIIDFFHTRWGGWKQGLYGPRPGRKPGWSWTVAGPAAEAFVRDIEPHVRSHRIREKIYLAFHFRANQSRSKADQRDPAYKAFQRDCFAEMRELNRRGVAA